jgi:hypothetical protein|tara:strand:- start:6287 stop:6826 length:540 start_codon:yes stop_codon:yes gene_type:complete
VDYLITGLPRSRTAWLANYLTVGSSFCYHEGLKNCFDIGDLRMMKKAPYTGNSDSSAVFFIDEMKTLFPDMKIVIIDRDYKDVLKSIVKEYDGPFVKYIISATKTSKEYTQKHYEHMLVNYNDINERIDEITDYCIPNQEVPEERKQMLFDLKVEVSKDSYENIGMLVRNKIKELLAYA